MVDLAMKLMRIGPIAGVALAAIAALVVAPACSISKTNDKNGAAAAAAAPNDAELPWCGAAGLPACLDDGSA